MNYSKAKDHWLDENLDATSNKLSPMSVIVHEIVIGEIRLIRNPASPKNKINKLR